MENTRVLDIIKATDGVLLQGSEDTLLHELCINSREVNEGDLFVPLIGEKRDAHDFIAGALEAGCAATLTDRKEIEGEIDESKAVILVEDTMVALQAIGHYMRARVSMPVVAVTGSVGKTTTREMISAALATDKKVFHTEKNFNSQIGVPITLSKMSVNDEIAVLECGMSEPGQIHILSDLVKPSMCVVTTIGIAHIEFLKTQENIRTEKLHIIDCMKEDGILFLNGDDQMLSEMKGKMPCKTMFYGVSDGCDYQAVDITADEEYTYFDVIHGEKRVRVELHALGLHNVGNAVAALAVSDQAGIDMAVAAKGLKAFAGQRQRMIKNDKGIIIIDDTYNASTTSMKASIAVACDYKKSGRTILVLGDMFELGENEKAYHYEVGEYIATEQKDKTAMLITVGNLSKEIKRAVEDANLDIITKHFDKNEEVVAYLKETYKPGDVVLLKGSNGMHMNEIVKGIEE